MAGAQAAINWCCKMSLVTSKANFEKIVGKKPPGQDAEEIKEINLNLPRKFSCSL